jgi:hypothetical protein
VNSQIEPIVQTPKQTAQKKYADKNKEKIAKRHREQRDKNPEYFLLKAARNRVQKFGGIFDLTIEDIIIPTHCPILGFPLKLNSGNPGGKFNSPSLDKKIPSLGYVKGNVWVISFQANMMKSNATKEDLLKFADWIYREYNND